LAELLIAANLRFDAATLLRFALNQKFNKTPVAAFFVFLVLLVFSGRIILAILSGGAVYYLMAAYRSSRLKKKAEIFESQLVEALASIAASVKAGHSLLQALESTSKELKEPMSGELLAALNAVKLGVPLDQALRDLARRNPGKELRTAVVSLNVARETGGNLGEALTRISAAISDRKRMRSKIFALTSQGRASGKVMSVIPFFLLCVLYLMEPDITGLLFSTVPGNIMLAVVVIMILTGAFLIKKVTDIDM
jgi:tight adherence protein B